LDEDGKLVVDDRFLCRPANNLVRCCEQKEQGTNLKK